MLSQISSFFSGLKSGKSKKKEKRPNWYDGSQNASDEHEDEDMDPAYFGCLGRSSSNDWNSRQRKNSRAASTQSLDKLGKQKSKEKTTMRAATSMLDLNSNKKNKQSSKQESKSKHETEKNIKFSASKDLLKLGLKSHRLGFGKLVKEEDEAQKEKKQKPKSEKLKRGYSWRQAYRQGSIPINTSSSALPRVATDERFVVDKSSRSSSSSSQNTSNETRQARLNAAPNQYSSTIHLAANFSPDETSNSNEPSRSERHVTSKSSRSKDSLGDANRSRSSIARTNSLLTQILPPQSPESNMFLQPTFSIGAPNPLRLNHGQSVQHPQQLPPPPPPLTSNLIQHLKVQNVEPTPFSALLRKTQEHDQVSPASKSGIVAAGGSASKHHPKNGLVKGMFYSGSNNDLTDGAAATTAVSAVASSEKPQNKVTFNEYQPVRESNYTPTVSAYPRKGSLKVEDLVQYMGQFEMTKSTPSIMLSTPVSTRHHQKINEEQENSNKKLKENQKIPSSQPSSKGSSKPLTSFPNNQLAYKAKKTTDLDKMIVKKLDYNDGEIRILDTNTGNIYAKGKLLGKGGFARCYEMRDLKTQKIFAGKIMSKNSLVKGNQMEKILREVELHFILNHHNVVGFHSFFEDQSSVYIMLEYCSRKSLVHVLKKRKYLTEPEVRYYMKHLTCGVEYIHSQKIIHRDLKLGNMLLSSSMQLKIADFGLATRVEYEGERKTSICGTPNYIAPEVLQRTGHSFEADIWAMGCVMYALLCGRPPFETSTLKETYSRIRANKYNVPPHVSMSARSLIKHLLIGDPYMRPTLERIYRDNFFQDGFLPDELSPSTCECPPKFPLQAINVNQESNRKAGKSNKTSSQQQQQQTSVNGNMAQTKGSRKSASQIITRVKASEFESAASSNGKDEYSVGSAPSIPNIDSSLRHNAQPISPARLYHNLQSQLEILIPKKGDPPPIGAVGTAVHPSNNSRWNRGAGVCVTKWVDYSNKYGFGFHLSNGRVGILFNDGMKMLLSEDSSMIQSESAEGKRTCISTVNVAPELQKKATLLLYFNQFMDKHLIPGGSMQATKGSSPPVVTVGKDHGQNLNLPSPIFLKKWFRTEKAVIMYLTDGTMQVNFFEDHTKVILNFEESQQDNVYVTLVDSQRQASTYPLKSLPSLGCTADVVDRLQYAAQMIEKVASEQGEGNFIPSVI